MIHKVDAFSATCDNCKDDFTSFEDHNIFLPDIDIVDKMHEQLWYAGGDPEHIDKHYCSSCWTPDSSNPGKILVDPNPTVVEGVMYKIWDIEDQKYLCDESADGELILYNSIGKCKKMLRDEGYKDDYIENGMEFHKQVFENLNIS